MKKRRGGQFGSAGLFSRIARGEFGKSGRAGHFTPRELALGRGGSTTINMSKVGPPPTTSTGPAHRRGKTGTTKI